MNNSIAIADARAREEALDVRRSFIVQAPAGSGKTELLVQRYIRLLAAVEKPEEIVAITFTIKAAAEMRKRVLAQVPNAGEIAHRLRVQTIDAFCASLTRQMPVVSKFGAQPGIVEDAWEHYWEAGLRAVNELTPAACTLLLHLDNNLNVAANMVATMLAKRDQWLRRTGQAPSRAELEAALKAERARLLAHARELHPKASLDFASVALTQKYEWRKAANPVPLAQQSEALRAALEMLLRQPEERYTDEQWQTLGAILELLPRAVAHLKLVFAEEGETDFTEVAQGAVRALGSPENPTDLLLSLDTRIRHILVDEFQDTSYSQWRLLECLTAGWEQADGRTLFLVGDPMQSIYRFREANVALFLRAWESGLGSVAGAGSVVPAKAGTPFGVQLERLRLTTNFRSQAGLVDWYNTAFPHILAPEADQASGAVPYSAATSHPEHARLAGDAVTWHQVPDRAREAEQVVSLVKGAEGRSAILVRNRSALADIVPALKRAGIRYRAIEIEQLGEKQVVQDLYALTRALLHLGDRVAWLSILRAPWLALPLERLLEIAGRDRFKTIWEEIKDDIFLAPFPAIVAPAIATRGRGSLRDAVEGLWLALAGPACVADKTELEDAERYLDALSDLEDSGPITDLSHLRDALERLYALPDVDATDDDLQIMTIHKAKGLEFGTVIVPGLDSGPGGGDPDLLLFHEMVGPSRRPREGGGPVGLLLAPIKPTGFDSDPTYRYLARLDTEAEDTEASRLLYVAATRAEKRLHLLACLDCDKDGELKRPTAHTLLSRAWTVAADSFSAENAPVASPATAAAAHASTINRLPDGFRAPEQPQALRWSASAEGRDETRIEFSWAGETARHVGTVVHRWLQRMAQDELRGWNAKRIDSLAGVFRRELQRRGVRGDDTNSAAELVRTALKNTFADERGAWALGPHPEARTEYRLRVRTPQGIGTYILDRHFRTRDGERWTIDYKTSRHEGANPEAFLDQEVLRYSKQLERYQAVDAAVRLGLYFPLLRGWREWKGD